MALDKVLKIYDEQGNSVDYDILASDVKFLPDGKDLPTKLTEMEDAIEDAAESGGYTPPQGGIPKTDLAPSVQTSLGLADTALQEADKIQLQAAINAVQTALNNLMNGQNVTDAIDTFNEVVDFLNDIDTDDPTLFNQLLALNNAITALQTALAGKISGIKTSDNTPLTPDSNGVVTLPPAGSTISPATAAPIMDGTAAVGSSAKYAREDHVHPHDTTKANDNAVVKSVTINGQTPQLNNGNVDLGTIHDGTDGVDGITPHIGQDGYWYIGTTNTGVKAQGERGNDGVSNADECVVVNNLDGEPADLEEGQIAVLGADQGKELKMAIDNKGVSFEVKGDTLFIRTAASPMVNVLPTSIQFDDTIFGNTRTATVHVYGRNLTSQVDVQVSGVGFSGSTTILPDIDGKVDEDVTITFAPTATTGTEEEDGNSYEGSVTAVCDGAESASATLEGFGVLTITPRITASIDKAALKGVLDTTADGAYTSEPATATLHVQASNINQVLTLAVDNAKFSLSESQISVEDAKRGKDITVTYQRQSAVTATDDECTITITAAYDNTSVQSTVAVSGATAAKKTSGNVAVVDGINYIFDTWGGIGLSVSAHSGAVTGYEEYTFPAEIFDTYGYRYVPRAIETLGGTNCSIKRLVIPSSVRGMFGSSKIISAQAEYVKMGNVSYVRNNTFNGCSSLREVDMEYFDFNYGANQNSFINCGKLETFIFRSTTVVNHKGHCFDKADDVEKRDYDSNTGTYLNTTTIGTAYYYTDALGNKKQKKLYVPAAKVGDFRAHAYWGLFEVHSIDELSE